MDCHNLTSLNLEMTVDFVILSEWNERKIHRILKYALILWILRCAQYDKERQVGMTRNLSFWAFCKKAKNPYFDFMDTSLCYAKFSMTIKGKIALYLVANLTKSRASWKPSREPKGKLQSKPKSQATQQKNPQVPKNKWILRQRLSMTKKGGFALYLATIV